MAADNAEEYLDRKNYFFVHETLKKLLSDAEYQTAKDLNLSILQTMYKPLYEYGLNGYTLDAYGSNVSRIFDEQHPTVKAPDLAAALGETYGDQIIEGIDNTGPENLARLWQHQIDLLELQHYLNFDFMNYKSSAAVTHSFSTVYMNRLEQRDERTWRTLCFDLELFYQFTRLEPYLPHTSRFWPLMELHQAFVQNWHLDQR